MQPEAPVRIKDTQKGKVVQFTTPENFQKPVKTEPVLTTDYPETDTNKLFVVSLKEEQQQEVSFHSEDTPSIWRRLPDGNR